MNANNRGSGPQAPNGWKRLLFRLPIYLYRYRLGWVLGNRFLLLNHIGLKSGKIRQVVLEVTRYDANTHRYTVASGFGTQSQWYRNLRATPNVTIQVGHRRMNVAAEFLSPDDSGEAMVKYAQAHPKVAQNLMSMLGYHPINEEDYRQLGQESIPFITFRQVYR
ncbi:MAG: nitroreductase family deazaflavin-dependent oxidoreductase [Chloroflexota bacterium]